LPDEIAGSFEVNRSPSQKMLLEAQKTPTEEDGEFGPLSIESLLNRRPEK
jgi:hypothetical protein